MSSDRTSARPTAISVVIPAFEAEAYIDEALASVLAQRPRPAEVIVVDDGSTDRTAAVARAHDPAVRVVSQANGGEAAARNRCLTEASSEWVAFLDADDAFLPGRLARMHHLIERDPYVDVITANAHLLLPHGIDGTAYGPHWSFCESDQRTEILRRNFVFGHVVVRRERLLELGGFDEDIRHATDWAMWIDLLLSGGRAAMIDEPLSLYRVHPGSLSANRAAMAIGSIAALEHAWSHDLSAEESQTLERSLIEYRASADLERLRAQLVRGASGVRDLAAIVARNRRQSARARALGGAALASPKFVSIAMRRRVGRRTVGTMGRVLTHQSTGRGA